ncbi:hypothetical protein Taro_030621, partial [Colocasia esculenta]|nr:hypothetical protein [Colocasia esculenta]
MCSSLTSCRVRCAGSTLWRSEVSVPVVRRFLLTWLLGVSRGDTWLFLPNLVEVWDVGACVVRLGSHVVAPMFRVVFSPTLVVGHGVALFRYFFQLLWLVRDWLSLLSLVREAHSPTLS